MAAAHGIEYISAILLTVLFAASSLKAQEETPTTPSPADEVTSAPAKEVADPAAKDTVDPIATKETSTVSNRMFGLMIGPFLSFGIPHPITVGVDGQIEKDYGANIGFGSYTYSKPDTTTIKDLKIKIQHFEIGGSWRPWSGSFFVGGELGQQTLQVSAMSTKKVSSGETSSDLSLTADMKIVSTYLTPQVGWNWKFDSGLNIGTTLGVQYPLTSRSTFEANVEGVAGLDEAIKRLPEYQQLDDDVHDAGKKAGLLALPKWEVIHVGWLF